MKTYKFRDFERLLKSNGFMLARTSGDHFIYKRGGETAVINTRPNRMICRRLIKEYSLI